MIHQYSLLEHFLLYFDVLPHPTFDTLINATAARAIQSSIKLGLIEILDERERSVEDIANICEVDQRAISLILECLESLGYVSSSAKKIYKLTKRGRKFLTKNSRNTNYNFILFSDYCLRRLMELEKNAKRGGPENDDIKILTNEEWDFFNKAMIEMAKLNAKEIAGRLPITKQYNKLLDLGGSHGLYAIEICKKHPGISAQIIDYEPTKKHAEELIQQHGLGERIKFKIGDFFKDDLDTEIDVILLFNVIHAYDKKNNILLFKKIHRALNKGGVCVILDQIRGIAGKSQLSRLFASALGLMLLNQAGGQTYYLEEIKMLLQEGGFKEYKFQKTHSPGFGLVIAKK